VVEVRDLLAGDEVVQQRKPARPCLQRVLVGMDAEAPVRRQKLVDPILSGTT
jgi:hypothetical protein